MARLLAAADPTPLERNRVDGVYVFTPSASSAIDLAMREITTAADALERMLLAAVPRELPGAWATRGSVCADTPGTYGLTGEIEAEPEDEVGLDEFGSGILPPQAARDY